MSEKIVQLNEEVIKGQIKECGYPFKSARLERTIATANLSSSPPPKERLLNLKQYSSKYAERFLLGKPW